MARPVRWRLPDLIERFLAVVLAPHGGPGGHRTLPWLVEMVSSDGLASGGGGEGRRRPTRVAQTKTNATASRASPRTGSGTGLNHCWIRMNALAKRSPAETWKLVPPVMLALCARTMMKTPMTANPTATPTLIVLVTRTPAPTRIRTSLRSPSLALSHNSAIANSGKTIPKTYASPRARPPIADPDSADRVITPTRTGAQQLDAIPEKTPRAKKLAESPRVVSGVRMMLGSDHIRPERARDRKTIIKVPPA